MTISQQLENRKDLPGCCLIDWLWLCPRQVGAGWQWAGLRVSQVSLQHLGVAVQMVSWNNGKDI